MDTTAAIVIMLGFTRLPVNKTQLLSQNEFSLQEVNKKYDSFNFKTYCEKFRKILIMSPFLEFLRFKNSQKATFANHLALK